MKWILLIFCVSANAFPVGFVKGEKVVCIYEGVYSWSNGEEFVKTTQVECIILEASKVHEEYSQHYQMLRVDCTEGLKDKWDSGPGTGLVRNHVSNKLKRWYTSDECYGVR